MTPAEQLAAISRRVHLMVDQQAAGVREVFARLAEHGLHVWQREQWTEVQRTFLRSLFCPRNPADPDATGHARIDTGPLAAEPATERGGIIGESCEAGDPRCSGSHTAAAYREVAVLPPHQRRENLPTARGVCLLRWESEW